MEFSDITKSVHDAWSFAWPFLVLCGIVYLIARFFNSVILDKSLNNIHALVEVHGKELGSLKKALEPYGLNSLIPLLFFVLIVSIMYLLNGPATEAVSHIPPYVSFSPDVLIDKTMHENEKLLLIRKYPTATDLNDAYYLALEKYKPEASELGNRAEIWFKMQNFLKFSLVIAIIMVLIDIRQGLSLIGQLGKLGIFLVLIAVLWSISLVGLLYDMEQQFHQDWQVIKLSLQDDAATILTIPATKEEQSKINEWENHDVKGQNWWHVYLFDQYRITWIGRTFLP